MDRGHGVIQTTTLAKLLAQKQELIAQLQQEDIGPDERNEIERLLEKIEAPWTCSTRLDRAGPEPPRRAGVQLRPQGSSLGTSKAGAGSSLVGSCAPIRARE
jgi:hypothetical protein